MSKEIIRKEKDDLYDLEKSIEMNPKQVVLNEVPTKSNELERIVRTTDSINILSSSDTSANSALELENKNFSAVREAILHSYDLARRKITAEYSYVINSNNYIDSQFFSIQIAIKNFEKEWNIDEIQAIIEKFTEAIPENIAIGKTIFLSNDLVFEPIVYYHKILPAWKMTPNIALLTNVITWKEIVNDLITRKNASIIAMEIIAEYIEALKVNIENGYYAKVSRFVVLQTAPKSSQKVLLFSNDTLNKINEIYTKFLKNNKEKRVAKYDLLAHYSYTHEKIKADAILLEKKKSRDEMETIASKKFVPRDLTEELEVSEINDINVGKQTIVKKPQIKTEEFEDSIKRIEEVKVSSTTNSRVQLPKEDLSIESDFSESQSLSGSQNLDIKSEKKARKIEAKALKKELKIQKKQAKYDSFDDGDQNNN